MGHKGTKERMLSFLSKKYNNSPCDALSYSLMYSNMRYIQIISKYYINWAQLFVASNYYTCSE